MHHFHFSLAAGLVIGLIVSLPTPAQTVPEGQLGQITGIATDIRGDPVAAATVALAGLDSVDRLTVTTDENGFFEFSRVEPGVSFEIVIDADGFAEWTSPAINLVPGQVKLLEGVTMRIATLNTTMTVRYNPIEIATEQIKAQEKQRIFGIIPNFYTSYEGDNAAPLTSKMKFQLALKVTYDPVSIAGVAFIAGLNQANDRPDFQQGAKGYAQRLGVAAADGFTDIMIGGAILPSLLHEDPRYFYKGAGTTKSRIWRAVSSPFFCKRDNGTWGPNYSSMGGDLASSAISNLYYPTSNRGLALVFSNFAIGTGERAVAGLAQEFLLTKFTRRGGRVKQASSELDSSTLNDR